MKNPVAKHLYKANKPKVYKDKKKEGKKSPEESLQELVEQAQELDMGYKRRQQRRKGVSDKQKLLFIVYRLKIQSPQLLDEIIFEFESEFDDTFLLEEEHGVALKPDKREEV